MPAICAIIPHLDSQERTLTCLNRVIQQSRSVQTIVIVNNGPEDSPVIAEAGKIADQTLPAGTLHILHAEGNLGNVGTCSRGMEYAFRELRADFAWLLDDNTWARPAALEHLLDAEADAQTIRVCVRINPAQEDELSRPLSVPGSKEGVWIPTARKADLPEGNIIPCRGGLFGALFPRAAWQSIGTPTEKLVTQGTDEYSWKLQQAGFRFVYEPGIPVERQYYKMRNWAWLQRLRAPRNYPARLAHCGFYIIMALNAMLECNELTPRRIYNLFRALHNGFYGKLRPY